MEHILIVTYSMIPYTQFWGGCQRMFFLANYLAERNQKATIICHKSNDINTFGKIPNFDIYSIDNSGVLEKICFDSVKAYSKDLKVNTSSPLSLIKRNRIIKKLGLKYLEYVYNNPSPLLGRAAWKWAKTARTAICSFIDENQVTKVVVSAPPFGLFRLIPDIKRRYNKSVPIYMDYRDPWNLWKKGGGPSRNKERKALRSATAIIVTNPNMKKGLSEMFSVPLDKINVISNGYSKASWEQIPRKTYKKDNCNMKFFYIGSISLNETDSFRNPKAIIEAFKKIILNHSDISLCFVGVNDYDSPIAKKISESTNGRIVFVPNVNQKRSFEYMLEADALIQLHDSKDDSAKYLISGKVYDYIYAQKPILAIGNLDGATQSLVKELGVGYNVENKAEDIGMVVEKLYDLWKNNDLASFKSKQDINHFSREYQNELYMKLILNYKENKND